MSKLKVLLLGGIISVLGFGTFSYSQFYDTVEIHCDTSSCDSTMNFTCSSSDCSNYGYICTTDAVVRYQGDCMRFSDGWIGKTLSSYFRVGQTLDLSEHGLCNINGLSLHNFYFEKSYSGGPATITCKRVLSSMPVSSLTPVINGLENAMGEFIPYVAYVGLGLISAVLGFVAIRRLVNRVRRNTFTVFKSRKKK